MIKNYLKIAFRNLIKHKIYSFINIAGLSVGLCCSILIMLFVKNELSYDSFHKSADNIYRISLFENYAKDEQHFNSITPARIGPALKENFPEVKNAIRYSDMQGQVKYGSKSFPEKYNLADPEFFKMFSFPLLKGNTDDALSSPNSVVLTESIAKKYFGDNDAMGKTISIKLDDKTEDFIVSGIAKDVPDNSSIRFNIVIPFEKMKDLFSDRALNSLTNIFCETYVLLAPGVTGKMMEAKMPSLVKTMMGSNYKAGTYNLLFQSIEDIHLDTSFPVGFEPISSPIFSYALSIIGFFILLIATINFVTLSIGKSVARAGEVGIRKVVGANRKQLIGQYWGESLLLVLFSTAIGIVLSEMLLPFFNSLAGKNLQISYDPLTLLLLFAIVIITGLSAGIYPAVILSSFNPSQVLMGKFNFTRKSNLRRILVGGQFTVSVIMIIGTIVIFNQLEFVRNKNLGYNKENVVIIPTKLNISETFKTAELFRNELTRDKDVISVTAAVTPLGGKWSMIGFEMPGGSYRRFYMNTVDYDYVKTMGMHLVSGRDFSRQHSTDMDGAVIVNEAFIKQFGLNNDTNGKMPGRFTQNKVIGVVKDFNFESLHSEVKPALITLDYKTIFRAANDIDPSFQPRLIVRIKPANVKRTIENLKSTWTKLVPNIPFESVFLKDNIDKQYKAEEQLTTIITSASVLSILITCLGLFGLTILITVQKRKEIGIRRLLGASVGSIYKILSKEFFWLIIAAQLISLPISWYLLNKWLSGFAYRIDMGVSMFVLAVILTVFIAFITITFQVIKASLENPVKSLRSE